RALRDAAGAESARRESIAVYHSLVGDFPDLPAYKLELGAGYNELGILLAGGKRFAEAEKAWKDGMVIQAELLARDPDRSDARAARAATETNRGVCPWRAGDEPRAESQYRKAMALLEEREPKRSAAPALAGYVGELIKAHANLANLFMARG